MNQVNQMYTYAQIPLKMSGQHASGELFVYTNKKALAQGEKDLTAFLHLDLDHLGSTDVSVRMRGREVSTRFYLDNDTAYALLEKNYPVLEARLEKKGYHCKIDVVNEEKHVNFVDDFLKMDQPAATQLPVAGDLPAPRMSDPLTTLSSRIPCLPPSSWATASTTAMTT